MTYFLVCFVILMELAEFTCELRGLNQLIDWYSEISTRADSLLFLHKSETYFPLGLAEVTQYQ
jgi:hypothetical protein